MKNVIRITIVIVSIIWCSNQMVFSQSSKNRTYKVWVAKLDKSPISKGYLSELGDSTISIMNIQGSLTQKLSVNLIEEIRFRKIGKPIKGILGGALIGAVTGAIVGSLSGSNSFGGLRSGDTAKIGAAIGVPVGAIIGGIIGHKMSVKIPIEGNQDMYKIQKEKLKKYQDGL